jgi:putative transposase
LALTIPQRVVAPYTVRQRDRMQRVLHTRPHADPVVRQNVEAFPEESAPRYLLRDRDSIYDEQVRRRIASLGITEVVSSPLSPWQNPYVERVIGSIRRECLDHVIILNQSHLRRMLRAYLAYYHWSRTHLGLSKDAPDGRPACTASGEIIVTPEVGGLHHRYDRQAA